MKALVFVILITPLFLISCFEEDKRVAPYPGKISTIDKDIEIFQSYFDLEQDTVIKSDSSNLWQLGFECGSDGWHIITNSGDNWFLYNTGQNDINYTGKIPAGLYGLYDVPSEYPDSTAVGDWLSNPQDGFTSKKNVYLLGRLGGLDYTDIRKIVFLEVDSQQYSFYYKEENNGYSDTINIPKTDSSSFIYYSFTKKKVLNLEPDKTSWDIVFGPYFDLATLFNQTIPYLVRGVMLNTWQTTAVIDSVDDYYAISFETIANFELKPQRDAIGYRWKDVVVNQGSGSSDYSINMKYNYLIRTSSGNYYKLRFLDYMLGSDSGYPQFEFVWLGKD